VGEIIGLEKEASDKLAERKLLACLLAAWFESQNNHCRF
jgi:hypothetical protein